MSVADLPLLFKHPGPLGLIQSIVFTVAEEYIDMVVKGYIVIHHTRVQRRAFIESHYTKQILSLYDRLGYDDSLKLWVACILYKYGGVCICKDGILPTDLTIESDCVGPVTVAATGSLTMKTYILRMFLEKSQAPGVRSMSIPPSPVRIYVLCHNETRYQDALIRYSEYPWAVPIRMKYQDYTFENAFWRQLAEIKDEWVACKMVGTVSYTAFKKMNINTIDRIIREQLRLQQDFYHFREVTANKHNNAPLYTIMKDILKDLRMPMPRDAYFNYWMCSPSKMEGFLIWYDTKLKPAVLAHPLSMTDSTYKSSLTVAELKALCGTPYYPQVPFIMERLNICFFKQFTDTTVTDNFYWSLSKEFNTIYNTTNYDLANPKIEFRYFCYRYLSYMRLFEVPAIVTGKAKEAVLIEYRVFPHVEFLIRNAIRFLGAEWSYTIICGIHNYEFMKTMAATIHPAIRVLLTPYSNLTPSAYSTLLASADFWNLLSGDKILIYQEDSVIFRKGIDEFMDYDYIGAPWPSGQNDAPILVGNGGFSLRSRSIMLDIIAKKNIADTVPNSSTADYMRNTGSTVIPEDVYFSKNMQELGIGRVAPWNMAFRFSTETQYNPQSFAGHNFWLNDNEWKERLYRSLFTVAHIRTPYGLNIGGGEKYLLDIADYFIKTKKCLVIIEVDEKADVAKKTIERMIGPTDTILLIPCNATFPLPMMPNYYLLMENSVSPSVIPNGQINIFHCQFPFNKNTHEKETLTGYDYIIVNSEFTKTNYETLVDDTDRKKIKILYPSCLNNESLIVPQKEENTFVVCGRLFEYNHAAHNKNFDKVIKAFNSSTNTSYKLHIIGACYSEKWLAYLKKLSSPNVQFHINCTDEEKLAVLQTAKFMINATGLERHRTHEAFAYEHFGISMIEGLAHGCIPITVNGGFPYYYVADSQTPLVFDSVDSLAELLNTIAERPSDYVFETEYYSKLLPSYNKNNHTSTLTAVLGASA
jgi:glycosyltransferase involved in cell wall biosynthesis